MSLPKIADTGRVARRPQGAARQGEGADPAAGCAQHRAPQPADGRDREGLRVRRARTARSRLLDLFEGRRQLIIYHFMFDPDWDDGCPSCTAGTDELSPGFLEHLHTRDTSYAMVSRAPLEKLERWKAKKGWDIPWYSSFGTRLQLRLRRHDRRVAWRPTRTTTAPRPSSRRMGDDFFDSRPAVRDARAAAASSQVDGARVPHLLAVRARPRVAPAARTTSSTSPRSAGRRSGRSRRAAATRRGRRRPTSHLTRRPPVGGRAPTGGSRGYGVCSSRRCSAACHCARACTTCADGCAREGEHRVRLAGVQHLVRRPADHLGGLAGALPGISEVDQQAAVGVDPEPPDRTPDALVKRDRPRRDAVVALMSDDGRVPHLKQTRTLVTIGSPAGSVMPFTSTRPGSRRRRRRSPVAWPAGAPAAAIFAFAAADRASAGAPSGAMAPPAAIALALAAPCIGGARDVGGAALVRGRPVLLAPSLGPCRSCRWPGHRPSSPAISSLRPSPAARWTPDGRPTARPRGSSSATPWVSMLRAWRTVPAGGLSQCRACVTAAADDGPPTSAGAGRA